MTKLPKTPKTFERPHRNSFRKWSSSTVKSTSTKDMGVYAKLCAVDQKIPWKMWKKPPKPSKARWARVMLGPRCEAWGLNDAFASRKNATSAPHQRAETKSLVPVATEGRSVATLGRLEMSGPIRLCLGHVRSDGTLRTGSWPYY